MAQRISMVLFVLLCGVFQFAPKAVAQEPKKGIDILFSLRDRETKKSGLLTIVNKDKDHKKLDVIVIKTKDRKGKVVLATVEPSEVAEIHFRDKEVNKKSEADDEIVLKNGKELEGEITSTFKIKAMGVTLPYDRKQLKLIIVTEKQGKATCWTAPLDPDAKSETKYRSLYPFWDAPQVFKVRSAFGTKCDLPKFCTLKAAADGDHLRTCHKRFDDAANFPQVRFTEAGECIETAGAIIYEGMQLLIVEDGRYELAFNASTPRVPVTMRLTLCVDVKLKDVTKTIKLTIPAVALTPDYRSREEDTDLYTTRSNNYQENWHVRHVGFSEPLAADLLAGGEITHYSRSGSARFGALPDPR